MMHWLVAGAVALILLGLMPWAVTRTKKTARGKGRLAGAVFAIGLAFGSMFDPAKTASTEAAEKKKETGDHEAGASGRTID